MTDFRDAVRALRATPIVTTVAILSLALGIGANTAIFSILNTLLLRSLPVKDPQQLAIVVIDEDRDSWTYPIWEQVRSHQDLFAGAAAWSSTRLDAARQGETDFVAGMMVSGRFFDVLGVPVILGRTFTEADDTRGGGPDGPVAVISYEYWQKHFAGAADAIGQPLTLDRVTFTVIGVTAPDFFGPEVGSRYEVAVPFGASNRCCAAATRTSTSGPRGGSRSSCGASRARTSPARTPHCVACTRRFARQRCRRTIAPSISRSTSRNH
jgi:hypothetical protein